MSTIDPRGHLRGRPWRLPILRGTLWNRAASPRVRALGLWLLMMPAMVGLTGCGPFGDQVTDCDTGTEPVTCERDERFDLAGTTVVVDELETITEAGDDGEDEARVEAQVTLGGEPSGELHAQLHIVEPITDEDLVIDPDREPTETGQQTITWDFSGHGYARRMQFDQMPPSIFLVFTDGNTEVTVNVMRVEYS